MSDLNIVFYGTPDFAVATLKALIENEKKVVGVVTAPDKPAGRGRSLRQSAVKEYAISQNLKVLQPENLKSETFLNELAALQPDLQIVVAFRMLPKNVWSLPKQGTFNLHASLLPQYRGAAPINWAIINGETKTGITTFFIDDKIDTGEIILQQEVEIAHNDTAGLLHDKLMTAGSQLVIATVNRIEAGIHTTQRQPDSKNLKTAYKLNQENSKIDWNKNGEDIYNLIRGLSPYPVAWCHFKEDQDKISIKIYKASYEKSDHSEEPGTLITSKKEMKVAVKDGYINIEEIQFPGKKKMDVGSFLNGYKVKENALLY
jgi:methionyl-tRNA formyltransferase